MSSSDQFKQISHKYWLQKRSNGNMIANNIKSYSIKKATEEYSNKSSYDINDKGKYYENNTNQSLISKYQTTNNNKYLIPKDKSLDKNNNAYQIEETRTYIYSSGTDNTSVSNKNNLRHHPNQVNNLIHNHKYYSSKTTNSKDTKKKKSSKTIKSERTEKYQRTQSLSPLIKNKYEADSKKTEYEGKLRYSSVSNTSGETNISISKSQLKKFMTNMWLEEIYCSNVESLCCLVDSNNKNISSYLIEKHEKELESNAMKIKDYEAEIIKLKSILNIKEKEMKKLLLNLKQNENTLKIKNKKIYELNSKSQKTKEEFEKDTHELQIISSQRQLKQNIDLDKDAISLQILSMKKGWNDTNVPSPINEIYIETIKHEFPQNKKKYEEMRRIIKRKEEEEIIRKKIEKQSKLEIQEMGLLSIISKKPKKNNLFQRLESIMILSKEKEKKSTLMFQKIEDIAIESNSIKVENEIQELDGLEIINIKKKKELILQEQCMNGLEIRRDYDMLLVKPIWDSLKIQGTGLNLLSMKKEVELENQEIDEFEILANERRENIIEKVNNFKITGKMKIKVDYRINKQRIKLIGLPKEEKNWNKLNTQIKSCRLLIKRDYDRIEPKIEINWDDIIKPIKTTKLCVKSLQPKINKLKIAKGEKFNFLHSSTKDEYDIENFNINLINSEKKPKTSYKMAKGGFNIKGKKKEKISLIKNRMDSINIFGLKEKILLIPTSQDHIYLASQLKIDLNKNWNNMNKIIKSKELKIPRKTKMKNIISKKVINVEIKIPKKVILKQIKVDKLLIKGLEEEIIEKASLKEIKTNRIFIKAFKNVEKKPEIILKQKKEMKLFIKGIKKEEPQITDWNEINKFKKENSIKLVGKKLKKVDWNRLIKIEKKPSINYIHKTKKLILKKQNLCSFVFKSTERTYTNESQEFEKVNNWENSLKAQRNAKFNLKGKKKSIKLIISKGDKFMIKNESEDEIIYNDDYNYLIQKKTENGNEKEKIVMIKEKEVIPILHREIKAQVLKVKEESSETSSQSEVDVLAGIKKKKMLAISSGKGLSTFGFKKNVLKGEVIFSPKNSLGVNLGGAKYKKEILIKKGLQLYNKTEQGRLSGIEISGNNGEIHHERMSGIGGTIKEGNYQIINGSFNGDLNDHIKSKNKLKTISQSSSNFQRVYKKSREPCDSKKNNIKSQLVIKSREIGSNSNEIIGDGNMSHTRILTSGNFNYGSKKIIFNSNLSRGNIKHSVSTLGINKIKDNTISKRKEETISFDYKDNDNFIKKKIKKNINPFEN